MTWTKQIPTENGYYFIKNFSGEDSIDVRFICYHTDTDEMLVFLDDDEVAINPQMHSLEFSGPLDVPE